MDPDECLKEIRLLIEKINNETDHPRHSRGVMAYQLSELVEALDEWIIGGGFLPRAWTNVVSEKDIADLEEA